jgi:hypothetical protein
MFLSFCHNATKQRYKLHFKANSLRRLTGFSEIEKYIYLVFSKKVLKKDK